jgi:hypothetical protein
MELKVHPQISRVRRQSAVEQTSDLLKAYLEHWPNPLMPATDAASLDERTLNLSAGFLIPQNRLA